MEREQMIELTGQNFDEAARAAAQPVLVDFWAPWCGPCRLMTPMVEALAGIFAGRLTVGKVNVDRHPELAAPYGVTSIPTLILLIRGEVVKTWLGVQDQRQLVRELADALRQQTAHS